MAKPLTKAQLMDRINALEAEVNALYQQQRPSRQWPIGMSPVAAALSARRSIPPGFAAAKELAMKTGKSVRVGS